MPRSTPHRGPVSGAADARHTKLGPTMKGRFNFCSSRALSFRGLEGAGQGRAGQSRAAGQHVDGW